jgi:hypothetical protein
LFITCYRDTDDGRYYVPVIVSTKHKQTLMPPRFKIDFLIDTGAARTLISWYDAHSKKIAIRALPPDNLTYVGFGGSVKGYLLPNSILTLKTNIGTYNIPEGNVNVSDYQTTDGITCPIVPSVLGMDMLSGFDLLLEPEYGKMYLRR